MRGETRSQALRPDDLLGNVGALSSPPTVYAQLHEVMQNPRSSILDIARVISNDQVLTAKLLKLANSPVYGFPSKIETINEAVTVLGTQQICDLALASSVMRLFGGIQRDLINIEDFWCHSVACGLTARILATHRREPNVERFFVAGIVHDMGRLIMYTSLPKEGAGIMLRARETRKALQEVEEGVIGFDHAVMGSDLFRKWRLPDSLVEMVRFHHKPGQATRFPVETAILHIADIIAHAMELGSSGQPCVPQLEPRTWERLELSPGMLADLTHRVDEQYSEAVRVIGVAATQ